MVLSTDDPNIRYIEKHFNVQRDEDVIDKLRTRVDVYEITFPNDTTNSFQEELLYKKRQNTYRTTKNIRVLFQNAISRDFYIYFLHKTILQLTKCVSLHLSRLVLTVCGKSMYVIV